MNTTLWIVVLVLAIGLTWPVAFKVGHWNRDRQLRIIEASNAKAKAMKFGGEFYPETFPQPVAVKKLPPVRAHKEDCGTPEGKLEKVEVLDYAKQLLWDDWTAKVRESDLSFDQLIRDAVHLGIKEMEAAQYITRVHNRVFS